MKIGTFPHSFRIFMTLFLVTLALCAIPVAGTGWNTLSTAGRDSNPETAGDHDSRWNTSIRINNVSPSYPGSLLGNPRIRRCHGTGRYFLLTYYDLNREALILARVDKGKAATEKVVSSARSCGVSLDINPVTGTPDYWPGTRQYAHFCTQTKWIMGLRGCGLGSYRGLFHITCI